jgi:hypothetical protein
MYKKPKYTIPITYSTISKYDSYQPENPIQQPPVYVTIPLVFQAVGIIPPVINEIPNDQLEKVKYTQPSRYKTVQN